MHRPLVRVAERGGAQRRGEVGGDALIIGHAYYRARLVASQPYPSVSDACRLSEQDHRVYQRLRNVFYLGFVAILIAAFVRLTVINNPADTNSAIQETAGVDRGNIVLTVSATGAIRANQETPLSFMSVGKVALVNVQEGDHVLKGQTLATLDTKAQEDALKGVQLALELQKVAYNALTAQPREADLNAARAALTAAEVQLRAANIGVDPLQLKIAALQVELAKNAAWQSQLNRDNAVALANQPQPEFIQRLYATIWSLPPEARDRALELLAILSSPSAALSSFAPSPRDAEAAVQNSGNAVKVAEANAARIASQGPNPASVASAQLAVTTAQVTLDKLTNGASGEQLAVAKAQLDAAQIAIDTAQLAVSRGTILAPFDGVVAKVNVVANEPIPVNQPAFILVDDSSYYVDVPVDESDISQVSEGQDVTLVFDALPGQPISGRVLRIATSALDVGGVVTYLVRVQIERSGGLLRSGMTTTASITTNELKDVVRVRNRFVRLDRRTGRATVTVQRPDGSLQEVDVKLGLRNETYSEAISGLQPGDVVVVAARSNNGFSFR